MGEREAVLSRIYMDGIKEKEKKKKADWTGGMSSYI
jgi:hypothetical protein